jgi:hypothetical protein
VGIPHLEEVGIWSGFMIPEIGQPRSKRGIKFRG